jgi:hypothetical protein
VRATVIRQRSQLPAASAAAGTAELSDDGELKSGAASRLKANGVARKFNSIFCLYSALFGGLGYFY